MDKHIIVNEELKERLEKIKFTESLSKGYVVTWKMLLSKFADDWEQKEAGVKP